MAEQWFSIVEYARTYSVSDMTVRRRIKTGKLHAVLKEGKYYIPVPVETGVSAKLTVREQAQSQARQTSKETSPRRSEISVVKSHPLAQRTYSAISNTSITSAAEKMVQPSHYIQGISEAEEVSYAPTLPADSPIPTGVRSAIEQKSASVVDTRALLAFCDGSLRNANASEKRIEELYRTRMDALSMQVKAKDLEINALRQQIEDMQLLVQILENKRI